MGSIDGLKEQVEELKQRLNSPGAQSGPEAGELKTRLASIKANLEGKQQEIARLTAEKQRLAAEMQRVSAENEQLRRMLGDVLAVIDGQSADHSTQILRDFLAETDALVKSAGNGVKDGRAAAQTAGQAASDQGQAKPAQAAAKAQEAGPSAGDAGKPDPEVAIQLGSAVQDEHGEEEESPALRRILKRGRRAV